MAIGCYWHNQHKIISLCLWGWWIDIFILYFIRHDFPINSKKIKYLSLLNPERQPSAFMPKRGVGNNPYLKDVFVAKLWIILITLGLAKTFKTKNNQVSSIFSSKDGLYTSFKKTKISNFAILWGGFLYFAHIWNGSH